MLGITKKLESRKGLTLVEVLLSLVIAGVSIISMMMLFPKMKVLMDVAAHKVTAVQACQIAIEDLRALGFSNINPGVTTQVVTLDSGNDITTNADDLQGVLTTTVTNIFNGPDVIARKILVQCQWNEHRAVINEYLDLIIYRNV